MKSDGDRRLLLVDALLPLLGGGAAVLLAVPLGGLGELAQRREVLHLLARAGVAVDDHVLADDLAALDLRPHLRQRERAEVEAVLLDQPALLRLVDRASGRLGDVEGTAERAARRRRRRGFHLRLPHGGLAGGGNRLSRLAGSLGLTGRAEVGRAAGQRRGQRVAQLHRRGEPRRGIAGEGLGQDGVGHRRDVPPQPGSPA